MHAESVLVREKGNSLHGELVGGTEDTDGNLASISNHDLLEDVIGLACGRATDRVDRVFFVNHGLDGFTFLGTKPKARSMWA